MISRHLCSKVNAIRAIVWTVLRKLTGGSDLARWSDETSMWQGWDARTIEIARLVPGGSSVLEFGAGRLVLPRHLSSGCVYTPSDICDRGAGTLVCDLNKRPLPKFPNHDVVVFSGVLEYVNDVPGLLAHLAQSCHSVVASYVTARRPLLRGWFWRRRLGWVNDYTSDALVAVFRFAGFQLAEQCHFDGRQYIYVFRRGSERLLSGRTS
jgi:hypothetical protein